MIITFTTEIEHGRPTETGVRDGVDYDARVFVTDEAGQTAGYHGQLTYAPDHTGKLVPYGPAVDFWMDGGIRACIEEPWIAAHPKLVKAIVDSLASGPGDEQIEVEL